MRPIVYIIYAYERKRQADEEPVAIGMKEWTEREQEKVMFHLANQLILKHLDLILQKSVHYIRWGSKNRLYKNSY